MNITKEKTDFGTTILYTGKYSSFAMYIYDDDVETIYLSNVYVDPIARGKNLGNKILKLADQDAKKYGVNTIFLNVLKDSWAHNWYERHGFSDYCDNGVDKRYVRMVKHVDESTEY